MHKKLIFYLFLIIFPFCSTASGSFVVQNLEYECSSASEVFLVWGCEKWKVAEKELQPPGTVIKNGVMQTPMIKVGNKFILNIKGPVGSEFNYGFLVTKSSKGNYLHPIWEGSYSTQLSGRTIINHATEDTYKAISQALQVKTETAKIVLDTTIINQRIKYYAPGAGAVLFVWGVNNWQTVSEIIRPQETFVENSIMRTPMKANGDTFTVDLALPKGIHLNCGFLIKGLSSGTPIAGEWHPIKKALLFSKKDHVFRIEASPEIKEAVKSYHEIPDPLNYSFYFLTFSFIIFGLHRVSKRQKDYLAATGNPAMIISWFISVVAFLIIIRSHIIGVSWKSYNFSLDTLLNILVGSYHDFQFQIIILSVFIPIYFMVKRNHLLLSLFYRSLVIVCVFIVVVSLLNIKTVKMLGSPFNYQWLYYSDFLGSTDSKNALFSNLSFLMLFNIIAVCISIFLLSKVIAIYIQRLPAKKLKYILLVPLAFTAVFSFLVADKLVKTRFADQGKLANPVSAFLGSFFYTNINPGLLSLEVKEEFRKEFETKKKAVSGGSHGNIKNVVIYVMESVSAEYLTSYGSRFNVTPNLNSYLSKSILFKNIYAHSPSTNRSMVSILGGVYPWISMKSITQEYPDINHPTLSSLLKERGYRTSFFSSGDNGFQGVGKYLSHRSFDSIHDFRSGDCAKRRLAVKGKEWDNSDGADDECVVSSFGKWVDHKRAEPFFSVLWTMQTHYPYFVTGEEIDYKVNDETFNRYLNALRHGDEVFGQLMRSLEKRGLADSTLVVVVGDHGEAFGRHGFYGHASRIYEENVHVPLLFINPSFTGEQREETGGHADIAPTLAAVLSIPAPEEWQGQSLFDQGRSNRTYFYAPWSDYLFGYREKNMKYIYNATTDNYEAYDLSADPSETRNLYKKNKDLSLEIKQRLAAWVQYQDGFMKAAIAPVSTQRN